uniref:Uncharacterized protein n=1 Tax=Moniliophthora roreri TaxID=221103 RepID=A0A0W0FN26_MONRR
MPHRWYTVDGKIHGRCWRMEEIAHDDGCRSWRVQKDDEIIVSEEDLLHSFPELVQRADEDVFCDVQQIQDVR